MDVHDRRHRPLMVAASAGLPGLARLRRPATPPANVLALVLEPTTAVLVPAARAGDWC